VSQQSSRNATTSASVVARMRAPAPTPALVPVPAVAAVPAAASVPAFAFVLPLAPLPVSSSVSRSAMRTSRDVSRRSLLMRTNAFNSAADASAFWVVPASARAAARTS
jgi:hypothetical protein